MSSAPSLEDERGLIGAQREDPRFSGIARLYGDRGLASLRASRVAIIGVGGVGTWVAESLARSAVGAIDLVDLDDICASNTNRQLHTLGATIGRPKAAVMAERLRDINPGLVVNVVEDFLTEKTAARLLTTELSFVVDAIDGAEHKCTLIRHARALGLPLVVCGGAGGRRDPSQVRLGDLTESEGDRLLARVRKVLRQRHAFPRKGRWRIPCVYSAEAQVFPTEDGETCASRADAAGVARLDCATGYGSSSFLTGTFGLLAASVVVNTLAKVT
jgi:tRNA A37 threonylcarbamoyladenosine dehydratase